MGARICCALHLFASISLPNLGDVVFIYSFPPCWRNRSAISFFPSSTAICRGVISSLARLALTSAPLARSNSTMSFWPCATKPAFHGFGFIVPVVAGNSGRVSGGRWLDRFPLTAFPVAF